MSFSQTKIQFNVRKKRNASKATDFEKEPSEKIALNFTNIKCVNKSFDNDICDSDEENLAGTLPVVSPERKSKRKSSMSAAKSNCLVTSMYDEETSPKRSRRPLASRKEQSTTRGSTSSSTPITLMTKLKLDTDSPNEIEKTTNLNPKKLYIDTPSKSKSSKFRAARIALGSGIPCTVTDTREERYSPLIGREEQFQRLLSHLQDCIEHDSTVSVYVSGPPGTGKTASLGHIMEDAKVKAGFKCIFINCTSMKTASSIYSHVAKILNPKATARGEKEWQSRMEELVTGTKKRILLVLDEMDQLLMGGARSTAQHVLYTVFGWPYLQDSRISLIGVANALDLTSRALPRLHASHPPVLIHFPPYSRDEIHKILLRRLTKAGVGEVFSAPALQMLASKVASVSGDVRRALDVGRRVVQLVGDRDSSEKKSLSPEDIGVLQPTSDYSSNSDSPRKSKGHSMVELQEVLSVLNGVYSTSQSLSMPSQAASNGNNLPVQQKFLLCSLILLVKKGPKGKPITIGRLHEVYVRTCKRRNITPVDQSEFHSLCTLVETRGIIRIISSKEARLNKISLQWDEEEVAAALMDQHLLASILGDISCLSR